MGSDKEKGMFWFCPKADCIIGRWDEHILWSFDFLPCLFQALKWSILLTRQTYRVVWRNGPVFWAETYSPKSGIGQCPCTMEEV
ncbi:hypothetical protein GQ457_07G026820 [Hibiscus cannabinus]